MSEDLVLHLEGLRIETIKGVVLVDNVNVTLKRGEILGLIGESGAGKSTIGLGAMAYARAGCRITGGRIAINGTELRASTAVQRRNFRGKSIAYIAQSAAASFNPAMTLMDQVCEAPVIHGVMSRSEAETYARRLFRTLQLPDPDTFGDRYPHEASGGQLQRAMAAMAMSCRPDIIVLDEPTTALDVTTQIEVLALLRDLIREFGTAGLYITHDLAVVAQIANRIMVLRHGKMVEVGDARQVLEKPTTPYATALVNERRDAKHQELIDPPRGAAPVLTIANVEAGYRANTPAVKNINLTIARGETVAVVGESGSGKSTLARIVTGLLPRWAGDIKLKGETLTPALAQRQRDVLRRLQMVHQMPDVALNPRQTLGEIIGRPVAFFFSRTGAANRTRVAELLHLVGLPEDFAARRPGQLSGGQKQRVCIARSTGRRGGAEASAAPAGRTRARLYVHHPRSGHGPADCAPDRRDAEGRDHRAGADGADLRPAVPSLYGKADRLRAGDGHDVARSSPRAAGGRLVAPGALAIKGTPRWPPSKSSSISSFRCRTACVSPRGCGCPRRPRRVRSRRS
jgi:peptide/nickel transport system ATP-binding protein